MKFCPNCGNKLSSDIKFCGSCGEKIRQETLKEKIHKEVKVEQEPTPKQSSSNYKEYDFNDNEIHQINNEIQLNNSQAKIVKRSSIAALIFAFVTIAPFLEGSPVEGAWALVVLGFFAFISSIVVAFIFKKRANKLQTLINKQSLLASWKLTAEQKQQFANFLYKAESQKNKALLTIMAVFIVIGFGIGAAMMDDSEEQGLMLLTGLVILGILAFFAFMMPKYYKSKHLKGDGNILIGAKYAYINGYFHNWDFPLSGLKKAKIMKKPFYGLNIVYYYTDRTLVNSEEIYIPASNSVNLNELVKDMKYLNKK
jgi:hypothetical protein